MLKKLSVKSLESSKQTKRAFLNAKILSDPLNYTITDRLLNMDNILKKDERLENKIYNKFHINNYIDIRMFSIYNKCDLDSVINTFKTYNDNYLSLSKNILLNKESYINYIEKYIKLDNDLQASNLGLFHKRKNVYCDFRKVISLIENINGDSLNSLKITEKEFINDRYFEALIYWYLTCINENSITSELFYLLSNYEDRPYEQLKDLTWLSTLCEKDKTPALVYYASSGHSPQAYMFFSNCENNSFDGQKYFSNIIQLLYGCELLYNYSISPECYKDIIKKYLYNEYLNTKESACIRLLYTVNEETSDIILDPELCKCFVSDMSERFNLFKNYFYLNLEKFKHHKSYEEQHSTEYNLFSNLCASCHHWGYTHCREMHLKFLVDLFKKYSLTFPKDLDLDSSSEEGTVIDYPKLSPKLDAKELMLSFKESKYDIEVNYSTENSELYKDQYLKIADSIKPLCTNISKKLKEIKCFNSGGKLAGLTSGKLDIKNMYKYKYDSNIFCTNKYKIKESDLAFGIILDESGSMRGTNIKNGVASLVLLHEVLTSLKVNHSIIGHTSARDYNSIITVYKPFNEDTMAPRSKISKYYGLVKAKAKTGNCDSGALYYMQKCLSKVKNKDKFVIIFSDGAPTECSEDDLIKQIKSMKKDGICVIGVGIDNSSIKMYYENNANAKNLSEMFKIVLDILSNYILEKKKE